MLAFAARAPQLVRTYGWLTLMVGLWYENVGPRTGDSHANPSSPFPRRPRTRARIRARAGATRSRSRARNAAALRLGELPDLFRAGTARLHPRPAALALVRVRGGGEGVRSGVREGSEVRHGAVGCGDDVLPRHLGPADRRGVRSGTCRVEEGERDRRADAARA